MTLGLTFDARLERARMLYRLGQAKRAASYRHGKRQSVDGTPLAQMGRADLASYWLGASERDRLIRGGAASGSVVD